MPELPTPVRAALGLAATMVDEAKTLPDKAIELPMLAVSRALKLSLRAQQQYSALAARGDEVLAARRVGEEAPSWATFDDPVAEGPYRDTPADPALEAVIEVPVPPAKRISRPRTGAPSAFDAVGDDAEDLGDDPAPGDPAVDEQ